MSEVQPRPSVPRGRGSARGGRGGFASRGARGGRGQATNGASADADTPSSIEAEGEVGQLKKKFGGKVGMIKEMFPGWTDEDVVLALQETDGDIETTVDRITEGSITQWGEVSKNKKDRSKSKAKDATSATLGDSANQSRVSRGGRAGFDSGRGGRGRGTDRGRGGSRGRGGAAANTNGSRKENAEISVPTTDSNAWDSVPAASEDTPAWETAKPADDGRGITPTATATTAAAAAVQAASTIIPDGVKKSWASMFAPAPAPKKAPEPVVEKPSEPAKLDEPVEPPTAEPEASSQPTAPVEAIETPPPQEKADSDVITPSKDELTETNLEQVLDTSAPAPTATAASTAASSWDPRNTATGSTPYSALQQQPQAIRPLASGFQASAQKATGPSVRTPSYQRRVLDQEEAVRMPGNREVDRAAVQFGAFNLSGNGDEDVDGDREDAETRAQPPQHSPVAPRAALPPGPQQPTAIASEALPTPKQAAGFPATTHPANAPGLPSPAPLPSTAAGVTPAGPQGNQPGQYGRYGQAGQETQKPYETFSQQAPATQSPFDGYTNQPSQSQQPPSGAFSSAPGDFSSYYTADAQQRQAYNSYYQQQYGAQTAQGQDAPASQQRSYSGYNNGPQNAEGSTFPQSAAQQAPSRYATAGEGQNSGHTTPNPVTQGQHQTSQGAQPQQPGHPQQPQVGGNYPYGHPYYSSPYYAAYMNHYQQYGGSYPGGPYGGKGGIHQQPYQGYAMSPGAPYEHASSPAGGAFGGASSLHGRDSALAGGSLGDYGRGGSAQSTQNPQGLASTGTFGGSHDAFGRNSSYQSQNQYSTQQGTQQGSTDDLKPFADSKSGNGPSPSLSQGGRPGSATNAGPGSALPPPQSQQGGGYGGYPSHLQQGHGLHGSQAGSQYGGLGGAGGHQAGAQGHQNSQYGGYGGFAGQYGGGYGNSQQQRGGWGGNYGH